MSIYKFYQCKLRYDGTGYYGWQKQKHTSETIQGKLEKALIKLSKSNLVKTIGCGRTDAGVHAISQIVRIEIPLDINSDSLQKALNSNLPEKIRVVECRESSENFNPVFDAISKEYRYFFSTAPVLPHLKHVITEVYPYIDLKRLENFWSYFEGRHDFKHFFTTGTPVRSTIRKIFDTSFYKVEPSEHWKNVENPYYCLVVKGEGFLKQMVRLMVGSAFEYAKGKGSLEDLEKALCGEQLDKRLGPVAPAKGLFLWDVHYRKTL